VELKPREIVTPRRDVPVAIPEGMSPNEFFNSAANLKNLAEDHGLLINPAGFLMYRKLLGHSLEFDTSILCDTSTRIINPLARPVRRDQLSYEQKRAWGQMTRHVLAHIFERYPDPEETLIVCGESSLPPTWPLNRFGVPMLRMTHNHFMVFPTAQLRQADLADPTNPDLTDDGHHALFQENLEDVYHSFLEVLDLRILKPVASDNARLAITGFPCGLPGWEVQGGIGALGEPNFWYEYERTLLGFLDFYRVLFSQVSMSGAPIPEDVRFPDRVENILLVNEGFNRVVKAIREKIERDPRYVSMIRWDPAYKQALYRDEKGRLLMTLTQNSVGNALPEMVGIVVHRNVDAEAYAKAEPALVERLLDVRDRLVEAGLGDPISTPFWPDGLFVPLPVFADIAGSALPSRPRD
jgi:hypothetical protein